MTTFRVIIIAWVLLGVVATAAVGGFSMVQVSNNTVPSGGYLLDPTNFVLDDSNGKLLAR